MATGSIRCGACGQTHATVADVRTCYSNAVGESSVNRESRTTAPKRDALPVEAAPLKESELLTALLNHVIRELEEALSRMLDQRSASVIAMRIGLLETPSLTLAAIGDHLGVSRERVRQLETKGLSKLKRSLAVTAAGQSVQSALTEIVASGEPDWEERLVQLAQLLLPDTPSRTARRLLLAVVTTKTSKNDLERVLSDPRSVAWANRFHGEMVDDPGPQIPTPLPSETRWSLPDAVAHQFDRETKGGPQRFLRPGWFYTGQAVAQCPRCHVVLEGFRAPYTTSAGVTYHYWGLACLSCSTLWSPQEVDAASRKELYRQSEHRPDARQ